mgnify:CR=1 FL=1
MESTLGSKLLIGETRDQMRALPPGCVQCVVTSPPYFGMRDYGIPPVEWADGSMAVLGLEKTPQEFITHMVEVFQAVKRVLRDDGVCFINLGDSYCSQPAGNFGPGMSAPADGGAYRSNKASMNWREIGYKPGDLMNIPHRVAEALQKDGWYWRSTIVWCLSGGTHLYARTAKGDSPAMLKDLVRLDPATVQLWNGEKWTRVVSWTRNETSRGSKRAGDYLEIELRSGERIGCTGEHHWPTNRGLLQAKDLRVGDVIPTCQLPAPSQSNETLFSDEELGWLAGFYIAEGIRVEKGLRFFVHQDERIEFERIRRAAEMSDGTAVMRQLVGKAACIDVYSKPLAELICQYVSGTNSYTKRLTRKAWMRPNVFLDSLLSGYLDGDGHWDANNKRWRIGFTNNDGLATDLRCACARIGFRCRLKRVNHRLGQQKFPGWRGSIVCEPTKHRNTKDNGQIVAIRKSRAREFWDIEVADAPHLFALASGVLTHNCKRSPMPESVSGWRWQQHRIKVEAGKSPARNMAPEIKRETQHLAGPSEFPARATWENCPGCDKCRANDGLVLRKGKWRFTQAHEYIFMLSKSERYFCDGAAVQELATGGQPGNINGVHKQAAAYAGGDDHHRRAGGLCNMVASETRNPRSVLKTRWTKQDVLYWLRYLNSTPRNGTILRLSSEPYNEAHFATFPTLLVKPLIEAGTSAGGCCAACESPYAPIVTSERVPTRPGIDNKIWKHAGADALTQRSDQSPNLDPQRHIAVKSITGYRPTCACNVGSVPCMVFDPFAGSGTTLQVAKTLGRRYMGTEINTEYAELAIKRINTPPRWALHRAKKPAKPVDPNQRSLFEDET